MRVHEVLLLCCSLGVEQGTSGGDAMIRAASRLIIVILALGIGVSSAFGQKDASPAPLPSAGTLGAGMLEILDAVLGAKSGGTPACKAWPPKGLKDVKRQMDGKGAEEITGDFVIKLAQRIGADSKGLVKTLTSSPTRLFDTPFQGDTSTSIRADSDVLGLSPISSPFTVYDTDLTVVKYDCLTATEFSMEAKGGYSIPFASIQAAFEADRADTNKQSLLFVSGIFQSPFVGIRDGRIKTATREQKLYAAMKGMSWTADHSEPTIIKKARIVSILTSDDSNQSTSLVGSLRGGVNLLSFSNSTELRGRIANSMESDAKKYRTFYSEVEPFTFPSTASLAAEATSAISPGLKPDQPTLSATSNGDDKPILFTGQIVGWPGEMCDKGKWTTTITNSAYFKYSNDLAMTPITSVSPDSLSSCNISLSLKFLGFRENEKPSQELVDQPGIVLYYRGKSEAAIQLRSVEDLRIVGQPGTIVEISDARWEPVNPNSIKWSMHVGLQNDSTEMELKSIVINPEKFICKVGSNTPYVFSTVKFKNPTDSSGHILEPAQNDFWIELSLDTSKANYNLDQVQTKTLCALSGQLTINAKDSTNKMIHSLAPISKGEAFLVPGILASTTVPPTQPLQPPTPPTQ